MSRWRSQPLAVAPATHTHQQPPVLSQLLQRTAAFTKSWIAPGVLHYLRSTLASLKNFRGNSQILLNERSLISLYALPRTPGATPMSYSFWRNKVIVLLMYKMNTSFYQLQCHISSHFPGPVAAAVVVWGRLNWHFHISLLAMIKYKYLKQTFSLVLPVVN